MKNIPKKTNINLLDFYAKSLPELSLAIPQEIKKVKNTAQKLTKVDVPNWENFVQPLCESYEVLLRLWAVVQHFHGVLDSEEVREVYNKLLPKISQFFSEFSQNKNLFKQYQKIAKAPEFKKYTAARKHLINITMRDYILSGAQVSVDKQKSLNNINKKLAKLSAKFDENVIDSINAFAYYSQGGAEVAGIPEDILAIAESEYQTEKKATKNINIKHDTAQNKKNVQYKFNLQFPTYSAIIEYAQNRSLREHFYRHYATRASNYSPAGFDNKSLLDNSKIINQILDLRCQKAKILGLNNYAELSLASKMAKDPKDVENFLCDLATRAYPIAKKELAEIIAKAKDDGVSDFAMWDFTYYSRILQEEKFSFKVQEVKQYFPLNAVIDGVFNLIEKLFNISLVEEKASVWHKDVKFYRLYKKVNKSQIKLGGVYCDFFSRTSKKSGAWMDEAIAKGEVGGVDYQPIAQLVCNFAKPTGNAPSLLTHYDVQTLLHEFGHVLHHILSQVRELPITGTRSVEWDAVELPSQWLEEFAWDYQILKTMSSHIKTGEVLPKKLFDKMIHSKNFNSGLATLRQVIFGLFDLKIHNTTKKVNINKTLTEVNKIANVLPLPKFYSFPHSFSHIFAGGYSAGYYSYKWAELLSCDAYAMIAEKQSTKKNINLVLAEVGEKFAKEVLAVGGSRPAIESFVHFRGRKPNISALLISYGLK